MTTVYKQQTKLESDGNSIWYHLPILSSIESRCSTVANNENFNNNHYEPSSLYFLPDFTEHPKPIVIRHHNALDHVPYHHTTPIPPDEDDITFFHDFIAGGVAGSASVAVGHPFDTIKVRMQTSKVTSGGGLLKSALSSEFGGISSLFRGMSAPLCTAAFINAIIFGSYGFSSRMYNDYYSIIPTTYDESDDNIPPTHDPWKKSMICGSFAGLMQAFIICPMEHVKCRLQTQQQNSSGNSLKYTGSFQATKMILKEYGIQRLYQGWWSTVWREVPAFGIYFASYDYLKDMANDYLAHRISQYDLHNYPNKSNDGFHNSTKKNNSKDHSHTWIASAFAGGCAGCLTWIIIYPFDVMKTCIQTSSLSTPLRDLTMYKIGSTMIRQYGFSYLFRGLGITVIRAFPVNGTIFPVYEFTLKHVRTITDDR